MSLTVADSPQSAAPDAILRVENLTVHFPLRGGRVVKAVEATVFHVKHRCAFGLVGESGCGKSTLARAILRLIPATGGKVWFDGRDVFDLSPHELRGLRREMQIIFQDPIGSLNPRMTVEMLIGEALSVHRLVANRSERRRRVAELLARVGLSSSDLDRYPHEFSGGQRQRIGIARALALEPKLIVCDEPVSALDVSIQSQILNLLADLQDEFGLSYLFISHDLAVVQHFCDRIAVMYLGRIVEEAEANELFANPQHPYTRALISAAPRPDPTMEFGGVPLIGEPPSPDDVPSGCAFHPRCPLRQERCQKEVPEMQLGSGATRDHCTACHLA